MFWRIATFIAQSAAAIPVFGPWWVDALNRWVDDDSGGTPDEARRPLVLKLLPQP